MLLIRWVFPHGDFLHTYLNYPAGWSWKQAPDSKELQMGVIPLRNGSGLEHKVAFQKMELTGEPLLAVQTEITFLFKLWLQNRKANLL